MNVQQINFIRKYSSTILTIIGAAGVISTAVLAVRSTPKAVKIIEKMENPTKEEIVKSTWKCYVPAAVSGGLTIACLASANILSVRQQAAMAGTYVMLSKSFAKYKDKVEDIFGKGANASITESLAADDAKEKLASEGSSVKLFYDMHSNQYFEREMVEVVDAEYQINKLFAINGYATMNEFYDLLNLDVTDEGAQIGWCADDDMYDFCGYYWLDFEHELVTTDDGLECYVIHYPFEPVGLKGKI